MPSLPRPRAVVVSLVACVTAALLLAVAPPAAAQATAFPSKPVRIIVTFTTGGAADIGARVIAERLSELWKQQVVVENRIGAGGNIGIEAVHRSPADGYTLLMISNSHAVNVGLYDKLPFDLLKDFVGITYVVSTPIVFVAHPKFPANTFAEAIRLFQTSPGKYSYASCGNGTTHHLAMELVKSQTRSFVVHVPYRGCSPATVDAVGGQVDTLMVGIAPALPHIRAGRLKALAVTDASRVSTAPDIPTVRESGIASLRDYAVDGWYGLAAPAGTPREVVAKIEADARTILARPEVRQRFAQSGLEAITAAPEPLMAALAADVAKFRKVIDYAKIKGD
jgi:tripartite-type tricarboxylate transporter receptor subunit TctC